MTALQELRTIMTNSAGDEIRIYDEYRYSTGRGRRYFVGYLVDNGKDRVQVADWLAALKQAGTNGKAWTKKEQPSREDEYAEAAQAEREAFEQGAREDAAAWESKL